MRILAACALAVAWLPASAAQPGNPLRWQPLLQVGVADAAAQAVGEGAAESSPRPAARAPLATVESLSPAVDTGARPSALPARTAPRAGQTLDLGTTSITGTQELPKVLYIVPWKRSGLGELAGRPMSTLLDEVLAPIDRDVFERQLEYYDVLYGNSERE